MPISRNRNSRRGPSKFTRAEKRRKQVRAYMLGQHRFWGDTLRRQLRAAGPAPERVIDPFKAMGITRGYKLGAGVAGVANKSRAMWGKIAAPIVGGWNRVKSLMPGGRKV